jgi:hypothetical protein
MQNPAEYRRYAEECKRLAQQALPEHKATLLEIAKAWLACAEEVERSVKRGEDKADLTSSAPQGTNGGHHADEQESGPR